MGSYLISLMSHALVCPSLFDRISSLYYYHLLILLDDHYDQLECLAGFLFIFNVLGIFYYVCRLNTCPEIFQVLYVFDEQLFGILAQSNSHYVFLFLLFLILAHLLSLFMSWVLDAFIAALYHQLLGSSPFLLSMLLVICMIIGKCQECNVASSNLAYGLRCQLSSFGCNNPQPLLLIHFLLDMMLSFLVLKDI